MSNYHSSLIAFGVTIATIVIGITVFRWSNKTVGRVAMIMPLPALGICHLVAQNFL